MREYYLYWRGQTWRDWEEVSGGAVHTTFDGFKVQRPLARQLFFAGSLSACGDDISLAVDDALSGVGNSPAVYISPEDDERLFWHDPRKLLEKVNRLLREIERRSPTIKPAALWYVEHWELQLDQGWKEYDDAVRNLAKTIEAAIERGAERVMFLIDPDYGELEKFMGPQPIEPARDRRPNFLQKFFGIGRAR